MGTETDAVRDEGWLVELAAGQVQARVWRLAMELAADEALPARLALLAVREAVRRELELDARAHLARAVRQGELAPAPAPASARASGPAASAAVGAQEPAQEPAQGQGAAGA